TGQPLARVAVDIERDYWMTTSEAIDYGILGKVISKMDEVVF
ncbi:MAG: ATP-dependent Clp protease proteolytic subunit 3, partial [Pseudomonadota bacterium]